MSQRPTRIVIVGHVDHGKSTMVGRLFHDTGSLPVGKLEQIQATCKQRGVPFEWAFLMDALQSERAQNITIDTSQIWFHTEARPYVLIDAPGHREFLKNMITGAASADAAFLLIAADEGIREQSRRHATMLSLLGISQVTVVVNKMDLVDYDEQTFETIVEGYRDFLGKLDVEARDFVPISARHGDNVAERPTETMPWYEGHTVVEALDAFDEAHTDDELPLRFPLQDIYRFDERRILAGRIESGSLAVGDVLHFLPSDHQGTIRSIERWQAPAQESAQAGESIGITLEDQIFVERGDVAIHAERLEEVVVSDRLRANVFWMGRKDVEVGAVYKMKLTTQEVSCRVAAIESVLDASSLEILEEAKPVLHRDDVASLVLQLDRPIVLDRHDVIPTMGRFVLVDGFDVAGGGIVIDPVVAADDDHQAAPERDFAVSNLERFQKLGHRSMVVWLEDPSLSSRLERRLFENGLQALSWDAAECSGEAARSTLHTLHRLGTIVLLTGLQEALFTEIAAELESEGCAIALERSSGDDAAVSIREIITRITQQIYIF